MISVIMPVYNGEKFVAQALQSVQAQTVSDWELVAVNDGSQDGTQGILEGFARGDGRIRLLSQPNGGVSVARNAAMAAARGDYFAFLDADDRWYPDHLAQLEGMIAAYPQAGLLASAYDILFPDGHREDTAAYFAGKPQTLFFEDFLAAYAQDKAAKCFTMSATCVKAASARRVGGFRPGCRIGEDLALTLRIALEEPVALCGHKTSLYCKAYSAATRTTSFDPDWYFFQEAERLMADPAIPAPRRESLGRLMAWFGVRRVRHYLIDGRRREAKEALRQLGRPAGLERELGLTRLLMLLPTWAVRQLFLLRWRSRA